MISTTAFIFALIVNYAATPEDAAKLAVYPASGSHVQIERTNVAGRYAAVLMRDAMMESLLVRVPILLERFSFGWQPLESLNFRCRLDVHAISRTDKLALMRGMPEPQNERACEMGGNHDFGPMAQVERIRELMHGPLLPSVIVIGDYALGAWYGGGGGEKLYKRSARGWQFIAGGGGPMDSWQFSAAGVPKRDWCRFGIYGAKCRSKEPDRKLRAERP